MINYDYVTKENTEKQNQPRILDHPYKTLIIGGSGSGKKLST